MKPKTDQNADIDSRLLELLVCPVTKTPLEFDSDKQLLISKAAGLMFPIRDGIAILTLDDAEKLPDTK